MENQELDSDQGVLMVMRGERAVVRERNSISFSVLCGRKGSG